jgi:hypothetical protein
MSITVAHRPHRSVPWLPIVVVLAVAAAAVLIALMTVGSSGTTQATGGTQAGPAMYGQAPAALPTDAQATRKSARIPWAMTRGSAALAAPIPAPAKYARAPGQTGGGSSQR